MRELEEKDKLVRDLSVWCHEARVCFAGAAGTPLEQEAARLANAIPAAAVANSFKLKVLEDVLAAYVPRCMAFENQQPCHKVATARACWSDRECSVCAAHKSYAQRLHDTDHVYDQTGIDWTEYQVPSSLLAYEAQEFSADHELLAARLQLAALRSALRRLVAKASDRFDSVTMAQMLELASPEALGQFGDALDKFVRVSVAALTAEDSGSNKQELYQLSQRQHDALARLLACGGRAYGLR